MSKVHRPKHRRNLVTGDASSFLLPSLAAFRKVAEATRDCIGFPCVRSESECSLKGREDKNHKYLGVGSVKHRIMRWVVGGRLDEAGVKGRITIGMLAGRVSWFNIYGTILVARENRASSLRTQMIVWCFSEFSWSSARISFLRCVELCSIALMYLPLRLRVV